MKYFNQFRIHVRIVVFDSEHDDLFFPDGGFKMLLQEGEVLIFHHKNKVGPFDQGFGNTDPGRRRGAGRFHLMKPVVLEDAFRRPASPFISAANE